ncbi:MAG: lipid-A-disaccharide synthase [Candidatus Gastranaerophilales bacterium]|nr:lipid-A-disaccharide synthase [Candidatus Gastranaerophilales bacterium]
MRGKIFIITGDYSGDMHASKVVKLLQNMMPELDIEGVGGLNLEKTGIKLLFNHDRMNVMGISLKSIYNHCLMGKKIVNYLVNEYKPDLVLLVDYGAFNLQISNHLKKNGMKIFYFIPPQIWASRKWRLKTIKKNIDKVFTIFPFESKFYEDEGINSLYVGHPLVKELPAPVDKDIFFEKHGLDKNKKLIGVFPGSRRFEIKFLFKIFENAAKLIEKKCKNVQFVFSLSKNLPDNIFKTEYPVLKDENHALLSASDALILASGTVALEACLYETPMIISYKGPFLLYLAYLIVRTIKNACLVNIITGKDIVPEFLMFDATDKKIADKISEIIENGAPEQKEGFLEVKKALGDKHCVEIVAKEIIKEFKNG